LKEADNGTKPTAIRKKPINTGHDPESIDVDPNGNVWITTTKGIFKAKRNL